MKLTTRTVIFYFIATLASGLLLGWVLFGKSSEAEHAHTEMVEDETTWTCSMHPQIRQKEPGSCPICGMELIPLKEDNVENMDVMSISMSPTAMQLASVATAIVGKKEAVKTVRLNGKVKEDERLVYNQTTHFPGRVEKLLVNFTGEYVRKGSTIAYLYSPELVTAQEELFETYKIKDQQPSLYKASREKLTNWKLSNSMIDEIISSGKTREAFPITADQSGYVLNKKVNLGDYVKRGQPMYEIANLSQVWVLFEVYESDLPWVNKNDSIHFTISSLPGQHFKSKISYIDPVIDPKTRVAQARVVVQNSSQKLKPEMFASGIVESTLKNTNEGLVVPKSAVMWTGKRSVVYVKSQTDQGVYFKMREVTLGPALGDAFLVEEGLETGEEIAVNGTFSIDAAAQLAGKPSMMSREGGQAMTGHNHGGASTTVQENDSQHEMSEQLEVNKSDQVYDGSQSFKDQLKLVFESYLPVKDALVASDVKAAGSKARQLLQSLNQVDMELLKGDALMVWMKDLEVLREAANAIANGEDLERTRSLLSPLSDQLYHTLKKFQVEANGFRQFCPMAFNNQGAFWLSDSEEIRNPYFGDAMLTCGNVDTEL